MILDGHIHIAPGPVDRESLEAALHAAGMDGGILLSLPPRSFVADGLMTGTAERLDHLFAWTADHPSLYPFYWIDPVEADAQDQVREAVAGGVAGFKIICSHFFPGDPAALKTYHAIAAAGKPVLFHSGILWDGRVSSKYNRPSEFEVLLEVDGLKFALAHVSWPWCDECIAVYGKFLNAYESRKDLSVEMFIDITPGTPPIYREEALTKLFTVGYDIADNLLFGTDSSSIGYNSSWTVAWMNRDNAVYGKLGLGRDVIERVYAGNLRRFLGIVKTRKVHIPMKPGE